MRRVTLAMLSVAGFGAIVGLAGGVTFGRLVNTLLFRMTATDAVDLVTPIGILAIAAVLAALPPVLRAIRIDPVRILRIE